MGEDRYLEAIITTGVVYGSPLLIAGKKYKVGGIFPKSIWVTNERGEAHNFLKSNLHKYFKHDPKDPFHIY